MADLGELIYTLTLNDAAFNTQLEANSAKVAETADANAAKMDVANEATAKSSGNLNSLALGAAAVAVGIGVVADKTVNAAVDYQEQLTQLVTGAGESQSNIAMISKGLLTMADQTGTSTEQLTSGLYMIESAGYHGAQGLNVLQAAAEGAKVGNADLGTVADATTTIMKDFGGTLPTQAVNELVATVANGKTHMQDLATSLAQIAPTASAAHVSLNDMMGAMATMTGEGVPAANAATYLRQTIIGLDAPSSTAVKAMQSVGLSSTAVATEMQTSLPKALQMITDAVGKKFPAGSAQYVAAIKDISGGSKTMQGMLDLTGQHMADFQSNIESVSGAVKEGGNTIQGWAETQKDASFKEAQFKEAIQTAGIALGQGLLPILTKVTQAVTAFLVPVLTWIEQNQKTAATIVTVIAAVSALILVLMGIVKTIEFVESLQKAFIALNLIMEANPMILIITAIIAAIALLVFAGYELVKHWQEVENDFSALWNDIKAIFNDAVNFFSDVGKNIVQGLINGIESMGNAALNSVKNLGNNIINSVKSELKVFSPSQVFADIGQNVSLGLAQGITGSAQEAVNATSQLTGSVISASSNMVGGISTTNNSTGPNVTYQIGQVTLSSKEAVDEFFSIGNRNTQLEGMGIAPLQGTGNTI